jgi:hypothetical protein
MPPKKRKTDQFRSTGKNILGDHDILPTSVEDFLNDTPHAHLHKSANTQKQKSSNDQSLNQKNLCRIHIQIRQDIADILLKLVFKRKSDPYIKGRKATQRAIIEEALESYFKSVGVYKENDD